jgi:hypothetical protein
MKEDGGGMNSNMICFIHCKNFHKSHSIPPPSTTMIKKRLKKTSPKKTKD